MPYWVYGKDSEDNKVHPFFCPAKTQAEARSMATEQGVTVTQLIPLPDGSKRHVFWLTTGALLFAGAFAVMLGLNHYISDGSLRQAARRAHDVQMLGQLAVLVKYCGIAMAAAGSMMWIVDTSPAIAALASREPGQSPAA